MFFDTVIKELIMDIIIFRIILILISVGLLYTTYQSYLREKYSGKKFVWSAKDIKNKKLKGYHCYEITSILAVYSFYFIVDNVFMELFKKRFKIDSFLVFFISLVYILVSYFRKRSLDKKENIAD